MLLGDVIPSNLLWSWLWWKGKLKPPGYTDTAYGLCGRTPIPVYKLHTSLTLLVGGLENVCVVLSTITEQWNLTFV